MSNQRIDISDSRLADIRKRADSSLYFFAKGICGFDWLNPRIHGPLCRLLQDPKVTRMTTVLPRSWLKTTVCSIAHPLHESTKDPNRRTMIVQNTFTNACMKLRGIKTIVEDSPVFRAVYPDLLPGKSSTWKTESLCLTRPKNNPESTFEAGGIRTQVISRHYDEIIEDDTVAPELNELGEQALCPTKEDIEQAIGYHRLLLPLLVDAQTSKVQIVGTRWFEKDLISWNAEHEKNYVRYERAVRETHGAADPQGDIVYPERFNEGVLEELRNSLGPYMFNCLYMNLPTNPDDMTFHQDWFRYFDTEPKNLVCYQTVDVAGDPAESKGKDIDYSVVMTCGKDIYTGDIYVLNYVRRRMSPSELIDTVLHEAIKYKPVKIGFESVSLQKSYIYWLKERMKGTGQHFMIEPITHGRTSKHARIVGLQPVVSSGMLYMRTWMTELQNEMVSFPLSAHDDVVDALSMQLTLWQQTTSRAERKKVENPDPFSFEGALQELRDRHKPLGGTALDRLHAIAEIA